MKKSRAPDLTQERTEVVLDTLDGWKSKLTWPFLIDAVEKSMGIRYSRYTLMEHTEIANAFGQKKIALTGKVSKEPSTPRDERVRAALEKVDRYRAKVKRLEQENQLLLEQFVTWATNAERKGVTIAMLNAPLPKPPRDRSKGAK
jgi:hypothetical protein